MSAERRRRNAQPLIAAKDPDWIKSGGFAADLKWFEESVELPAAL
jgi:hypothetical protein